MSGLGCWDDGVLWEVRWGDGMLWGVNCDPRLLECCGERGGRVE